MTIECDVLVVGLGPAGGAAAAVAAEAGARVIAIDRKAEVGTPVQCAEFIPAPLACPSQSRVQPIAAMHTCLPSGAIHASPFTGWMIDRADFDRQLAQRAAQAGAQLLLETRLVALGEGSATVRRGDAAQEVRYRMLIAADGPASPVARCLGLAPLECVQARQYTVALAAPHEATEIWLAADYPGGYAWLFPKGPVANLGVGFNRRFAADLKAPLDRLHRQLVDAGVVGAEIRGRTGGAIPVGGLRDNLVCGQVLFAGDAAGLTHPITGAGIAAAVLSGEAAGSACASALAGNGDALADYADELRAQFGASLARGLAARRRMESIWNTPAARTDSAHRHGWIAFDEFYAAEAAWAA